MAEVSSLIVQVKADGVEETAKSLDKLGNEAQQAETATKRLNKEFKGTATQTNVVRGSFGAAKNATQQLSFQLQDVAVQAQMGTSAFVILGQQGPQIASIFGPGGAVAGALIAFGSLLGGIVYSMINAGEGVDELRERVKGLGLEFSQLTKEQQELIRAQNLFEIARLEKENADLEIQARKTGVALVGLAKTMTNGEADTTDLEAAARNLQIQMQLNNEEIKKLKQQNEGYSGSVSTMIESLREEESVLGMVGRERDLELARQKGANEEQIKEINALYDLIDAKKKEIQDRKDNERALRDEQKEREKANLEIEREIQRQETLAARRLDAAMQAGMSPIERMRANLEAQLELLEQDRLAATVAAEQKGQDILAIEMMYDQARINLTEQTESQITQIITREEQLREQIRLAAEQMAIARAQATAGQLTSITKQAFGEQSAAAKAMFALQQALAMAQIIVSTEQAAVTAAAQSSVLGGLAGFLSTQAAIRAMGAISLGIVAGQTVAGLTGRALGGQVRGGQSYIVGERGPELLTMGTSGRIASNDQLRTAMRETESSNNNMVTVNFAIQANDTQGFDRLLQSRRGQIVTMMQQAFSEKGRKLLA
jgi:hypothetical protein